MYLMKEFDYYHRTTYLITNKFLQSITDASVLQNKRKKLQISLCGIYCIIFIPCSYEKCSTGQRELVNIFIMNTELILLLWRIAESVVYLIIILHLNHVTGTKWIALFSAQLLQIPVNTSFWVLKYYMFNSLRLVTTIIGQVIN